MIKKAMPIFDHAYPKIIELLTFHCLYKHAKNKLNSSTNLQIQQILESYN